MAATSKTRTELVHKALSNLGALEPGEAPSAEDYNTVNGLIDPLLEQLMADGIVSVVDPDEIQFSLFLPLARLPGKHGWS